jgi:hypothetical protein
MRATKFRTTQIFGILGCLLMLTVMLPSLASALDLTLSEVKGEFENTVGGTDVTYYTDLDHEDDYGNDLEAQVRWGIPVEEDQSGLGFTGVAPPASSFNFDDVFEIGQLRHFNNNQQPGTSASATDLAITMKFTTPSGEYTPSFTFDIEETPNTGDPPVGDDFITFPSSIPDETFPYGGKNYTLELLGFGDTSDDLIDKFISPEYSTNATLLWGKITESEDIIPEPTTIFLMGFGILGLAGIVARQRRKDKA